MKEAVAEETLHEQGVAEEVESPDAVAPAVIGLESIIAHTEKMRSKSLEVEKERFEFQQRLANIFAASGMFIEKKVSPSEAIAKAMVRIMLGDSMGFSAAESMQGIDIISGRPAISSGLRASRMQEAGFFWTVDNLVDKTGEPSGCRLWMYKDGKPIMRIRRNENGDPMRDKNGNVIREQVFVEYTRKDAARFMTTIWEGPEGQKTPKRVPLLEKDNWKNNPGDMYFARAITRAQRRLAPGALKGINILSVEEAMDLPEPEAVAPSVDEPRPAAPPVDPIKAKMREDAPKRSVAQLPSLPTGKTPGPDELPFDPGA